MILKLLALICILFVSSAWGGLKPVEFSGYIEHMCFQNDEETGALKINGQTHPLASTLENFIALAEKFELKNPDIGLKNELFYFIRNYTYENIKFTKTGSITTWTPAEADYTDVSILWEPNEATRNQLPQTEDPFTDSEKCSIFFMLSHSVVEAAKTVDQQKLYSGAKRSYTNASFDGRSRSSINLEDLYPQEQGVVSIRGTTSGVSLSRVLTGLYVGLDQNRFRNIDSFPRIQANRPDIVPFPREKMVDPLYTLTLAEVLMIAQWEYEERDLLGMDGQWKAIPVNSGETDVADICPMIYKLENADSAYTYSSVRGAADGLILGKIAANLERKNRNMRLSQILRMYYSRGGIFETADDNTDIRASFCSRESNLERLAEPLSDQVLLFEFLITRNFQKMEERLRKAIDYYHSLRREIYRGNQDIMNYCDAQKSLDKPEELELETPLDVVVVLDSTDGKDSFLRQQLIIGHFAKHLDLRYSGSRLTILRDKRTTANGAANGIVELEPVVEDALSSSCVACMILRIPYENSASPPRDQIILALDQFLEARKENETRFHGVNGKVVIYFNFDENTRIQNGNKEYSRLEKVLRDLHVHHQAVSIYAVGKNSDVLKRFAKQDMAFVMTLTDGSDKAIGENIINKISAAPGRLQYSECEDGKGENTAIFDYFVTPNARQHWEMPPEYFYKSRGLKFHFDTQYGTVRVCHNRANRSPELQVKNCHEVANNRYEFKDSNPCSGVPMQSCSPYFFTIIGINSTDDKSKDICVDTVDAKCRTLDQIKFKVSHEGIRCSGGNNLIAFPAILLLAALISQMFSKVM